VAGWGRVVAGVVLGVAGTVYATNEEVRKNLPKAARDLPENVRRRYQTAVSAAREASNRRREEILRDLEAHGGANHAARRVKSDNAGESATPDPASARTPTPAEQTTENPE
jgi:cation transport regulator ChaB